MYDEKLNDWIEMMNDGDTDYVEKMNANKDYDDSRPIITNDFGEEVNV